ncbi:GntR family transcriptional regulator [Halodesulfovibrio sp. MK-HDV]|jgi:DNA-binding GntR family transcriptional regulator|uniref:GntR family transcriptional regulator n=1 Tax=unclassified Halodesulfovibrio TaxID=2644657 RepID=UPI00136ED31F|nr:GntR family transcriptional regulator [Halodesulfovibrio sp. MK-HDV]KAF1076739.1 HTH-type transcriptional regulator McbR [Halodesulfovibrio sp. MK-HDV]
MSKDKQNDTSTLSARDRVYQYLMKEMHRGTLLPGSSIDLKRIKDTLTVSSTPLRDALIKLESEGFVTIHPRSRVTVNTLEIKDFPFLYNVIGGIECTLIIEGLNSYTPDVIAQMRELNAKMKQAITDYKMSLYDEYHYAFHDIFLQQCDNLFARRILTPIKHRLWDFPRRNFLHEWYLKAFDEHEAIIRAIEAKDVSQISHALKDIHWGYELCKNSIKVEYNLE